MDQTAGVVHMHEAHGCPYTGEEWDELVWEEKGVIARDWSELTEEEQEKMDAIAEYLVLITKETLPYQTRIVTPEYWKCNDCGKTSYDGVTWQ